MLVNPSIIFYYRLLHMIYRLVEDNRILRS